jgi:hypothetical protein
MADSVGSLIRHAATAVCLVIVFGSIARAQPPLPSPVNAPDSPQFLPRAKLNLSAASLGSDDPRFSWDTHYGGDIDLVDYVVGRLNVIADYQAILGSEFRRFDPNQGNYTLEASASARLSGVELAGMFHHVSRHLSDRSKREAIAWNVVGVRALRRFHLADTTVDVQGSVGNVVEHAFVDYGWTSDLDLVIRHRLTRVADVYAHGFGRMLGIDADVSTRPTQRDGRLELGIRLRGGAAAVELFAGLERRVDADPFDTAAQRWGFAGFRLLTK